MLIFCYTVQCIIYNLYHVCQCPVWPTKTARPPSAASVASARTGAPPGTPAESTPSATPTTTRRSAPARPTSRGTRRYSVQRIVNGKRVLFLTQTFLSGRVRPRSQHLRVRRDVPEGHALPRGHLHAQVQRGQQVCSQREMSRRTVHA